MCEACQLKYPVRDDVPVMMVEEALDLRKAVRKGIEEKAGWNVPSTTFKIIDGPNQGLVFHLEMGTCKAIGRTLSDPNKTAMFNVDLTLALDDSTEGLVLQYITRQFRKAGKEKAKESGELGTFKRTSDITIDDAAVSRLHAMLFFDEVGVGILDLVSKNGTFVNGEEVESRLLRKHDTIEIGESKIVFEG